ncbi:MAG: ATP-dependent Clp protease adapter ClpS [bacterium]|nr:ATP-dependent Clp protease adapter ClpS [bacterium]
MDELESEAGSAVRSREVLREPPLYQVLLLNDDYTTMEFVVYILRQVFNKSGEDAEKIMLTVHQEGKAVVGVYTREIAETKIALVAHQAKESEFPLRCVMQVV